ncbi:MAG: ABC transporter permease [Candidatus Omnitrophica bacterium]|nr:ABC transporter permease [Candidatus Omnitrophota bacterium]MDD5774724.1 ABC transporter permease [Candidatus Omnitrophota bacterium]HNQ50535.1 ABC transporter permease [Candidatus Omnitrophota bacterium]HQO37480.1 ABC transporter permease [Candidatus Omnitrophota bacterium]HQQ06505.1 ABC transporter permease [Candidatus Omnitrophota bacterium]
MSVSFFIAWRYLITKRKEKFISLISLISILGVAIGVMALIVVIAVMTGFDIDLRDKIIGNYSHITVAKYDGMNAAEYDDAVDKIRPNEHVLAVSPFVQGQVLVSEGKRFMALSFRGIDPEREQATSRISRSIVKGSLQDLGADSVIIGKELALYLGAGLGSPLTFYSALGKTVTARVAGIFSSGMYDYDMNLVFFDLGRAQSILGAEGIISALSIKLDNVYYADTVKRQLQAALGYEYTYKTWMEQNQNFFAALKLEKLTMFIILTLIILVASFNIISTLIVMVVEKTKDIGILKALGMSSADIRKVFMLQGLAIGFAGTFSGTAGGVILCYLLKKYQFIKLPQDVYYIDRLPVALQVWPDLALVAAAAMCITLVSCVYPAFKAASMRPVEALRYE